MTWGETERKNEYMNKERPKREAVSPSRPLICSADGDGKDAERLTPNEEFVRHVQNCRFCSHQSIYYCDVGRNLYGLCQCADNW